MSDCCEQSKPGLTIRPNPHHDEPRGATTEVFFKPT